MSAVAVVGTLAVATGVGAAQANPVGDKVPVTKADCKQDGFKEFGFKNQGQCIKYVVKHNHSNGYGNDQPSSTPVTVTTSNTQHATTGNAIGEGATSGSISISNTFNTVVNFFAGLAS